MIVTFKLNVAENADKIKYSKVTLEKTGLLPGGSLQDNRRAPQGNEAEL